MTQTRNFPLTFELRRPDASGEFPLYQPQSIGDVDELARLALGATLVHELPLPPIDSLPHAVRWPAPTTHRAEEDRLAAEDDGRLAEEEPVTPAAVLPQPVRPPGYRGDHRMVEPDDLLLPLLALGVVGSLLMIVVQVALLQVAIRVSGAVL